ncbi:hypothetical protein BG015_003099, partial [Linnemannia schmuckeri]
PKICLQLEGGLCLLGRLSQLRRLRVVSLRGTIAGSCKEMNLNGMTLAGQTDKFRGMGRKEVESWRRQSEIEEQQETNRAQQLVARGATEADAEVWAQLQHLSLLEDVEEMVKEMDAKLCRPSPSLEELAFDRFSMQWSEKVIERLFRGTRKSLFGIKLG